MTRALCWLQGALALLLGIQAVVVATLIVWLDHGADRRGRFELVRVVDHEFTWHMWIDTRWIILACLALSACAQALALVLREGQWLRPMRWLEAAVCMPTATMAVAVEAGVRDVYAIEALFGLAWCAQVLSMCAWRHSDALPQYAAWCALLMAYGPILNALSSNQTKSFNYDYADKNNTNNNKGETATVLVAGEFVLAALMLGVYTYERLSPRNSPETMMVALSNAFSIRAEEAADDDDDDDDLDPGPPLTTMLMLKGRASSMEPALVLLSFLAHTLLCWSVLGPLLTAAAVDSDERPRQ
jgi:hypothetical protein